MCTMRFKEDEAVFFFLLCFKQISAKKYVTVLFVAAVVRLN